MLVQTLTATGPLWKTADGLTVGDSVAKLDRLYPDATRHPGGDWLTKIDRRTDHALLTAVVRGGRVAEFSLAVRTVS